MSIEIIEAERHKTGTEADRALAASDYVARFSDQSIRNLVEMRRWMQLPPKGSDLALPTTSSATKLPSATTPPTTCVPRRCWRTESASATRKGNNC